MGQKAERLVPRLVPPAVDLMTNSRPVYLIPLAILHNYFQFLFGLPPVVILREMLWTCLTGVNAVTNASTIYTLIWK